MGRKPKPIKVTFHHIKAKNEEERLEQVRKIEAAFAILFEETLKRTNEENKKSQSIQD